MDVKIGNNVYVVVVREKSDGEILHRFISGDSIPLPDPGETISLRGTSELVEVDEVGEKEEGTDEIIPLGQYTVEDRQFNYDGMAANDIGDLESDTLGAIVTLMVSPTD